MSESRGMGTNVAHNIILNSRAKLSINGVKEIINFDENSVNLKTLCGDLSIEGENIRINVLNVEKGEIEMNGKITGLNYYDAIDSDRHSLLSRIFK